MDYGESSQNIRSEDMPEIAMSFDDFDFDNLMHLPDFKNDINVLRSDSSQKAHATDVESNPKVLSEEIPENATNIDDVDATIAKQMMALSVEDREKVYMDVHGVKEGTAETEEVIRAGLESMQTEIEKLHDKDAYELALSMDQHYVENRFLRLAFLRSEYFNARKAAVKIVRHFQLKLDLFGKEKLALDIVQDDLDRDTINALYSGRGQFLDARDRAGRYILMVFFGDIFAPKATLQRAFYNTMVAIRNPDVQIHGFVALVFALVNLTAKQDTSKVWNFSKMTDGVPIRFETIHFCQNGMIPQEQFAVSKSAVCPFLKIRTRTHCGMYHEVISSLAQYGIASGSIPITEGFKLTNLEVYDQHLRDMRSEERLNQPRRHKIGAPSRLDILFGKGLPCQIHPGNVKLRGLVAERHKSYEKAVKGEKREIAQDILQTIQRNSGLFLRPDGDDSWVCVEDDVARQKVSNLFRTLRLKISKQ